MDKRIAVRWQLAVEPSVLQKQIPIKEHARIFIIRSSFIGFVLNICNSRSPFFVVSLLTWSSNERNHARAWMGPQLSLNMTQHGGLELSVLKQRIKNALDINCKVHQSHRRQNVKLSLLLIFQRLNVVSRRNSKWSLLT